MKYLIPLAIEVLEIEPLIEAYYFEGDLLSSVLKADERYWQEHKMLYERVNKLVAGIIDFEYSDKLVKKALNQFNSNRV